MIELVCPVCHGDDGPWCDFCATFQREREREVPGLIPPETLYHPIYARELARYESIASQDPESYPGYAASHPVYRAELVRGILDRAGVTEFVNVGPGFGALEAVTPDLSEVAVDYCLSFLLRLESVRRVRALAERLPLATGGVACLVADCVFQSIVDREAFLCEVGRVVEPGGLFVFSIATGWNYPRRPQNGFEVTDAGQLEVLLRYLKELGFKVVLSCIRLESEQMVDSLRGDYLLFECRKDGVHA